MGVQTSIGNNETIFLSYSSCLGGMWLSLVHRPHVLQALVQPFVLILQRFARTVTSKDKLEVISSPLMSSHMCKGSFLPLSFDNHKSIDALQAHIYRISEWLRLEGTSGGYLVQSPCSSRSPVAQDHVQMAVKDFKVGDSTTSLGNLFLCSVIFTVKQ